MPTVPGPVLRVRMAIADVSESASCCCREGQTRMCKTSNSPQKTAGCGRRNRLLVCRNSWTALHDAANKNDFELCKILCRSDRAAKLHLYSTNSGAREAAVRVRVRRSRAQRSSGGIAPRSHFTARAPALRIRREERRPFPLRTFGVSRLRRVP